jgi:S1-C subfamily serine protease
MYLKRLAGPVADAGVYDRAGMWINTDGQGFRIVDVSKAAPAEAAGLVVGDIITSVDGVPSSNIHLYDLRLRLRDDPPGTIVTLAVQRGGETKSVKLTLRDLI